MGKIYIGWLEEDSLHSVSRAKERAGLNEKRARKTMNLARQRGIRSEECHWNIDKTFLESKSDEHAVAVAFNGFCYVFERQTMHCITLVPLPKDFGKKKTYYRENNRKSRQRLERQDAV